MIYFIYDTAGNCIQNLVRDASPISSHKICSRYTAESQGVIIGAEVAHYTHCTSIGENRKVLVDRPVKASLGNFFSEDPVSIT